MISVNNDLVTVKQLIITDSSKGCAYYLVSDSNAFYLQYITLHSFSAFHIIYLNKTKEMLPQLLVWVYVLFFLFLFASENAKFCCSLAQLKYCRQAQCDPLFIVVVNLLQATPLQDLGIRIETDLK